MLEKLSFRFQKHNPPLCIHWSLTLVFLFLLTQSLTVALIYATVLSFIYLHEMGHVLMARRLGYPTSQILFTPIGGLAQIHGGLLVPKEELLITIAGPAVNFVLALIFFLLSLIEPGVFTILMEINLWLGTFNLLPAFPLDGGRIVRSTLGLFSKNYLLNTKIAMYLAFVVAAGMVIFGIIFNALNLLIIAGFVIFAAQAEYNSMKTYLGL